MEKCFVELDTNGDGTLSKRELLGGMRKFGFCPQDAEKVLKQCDLDGDGLIDCSEFITASINWKKSLS